MIDKYEQALQEMEEDDPPIDPLYGILFLDDLGEVRKIVMHDRRDFLNVFRLFDSWEPCDGAVMCYWERESLQDWEEGLAIMEGR